MEFPILVRGHFKHTDERFDIEMLFIIIKGFEYFEVEVALPESEPTKYDASRYAACPCKPCMTGPKCQDKVSNLNPRFSQRYYFVELPRDYKPGSSLPYNSTTYPGGKRCPCEDFEYVLSSVQNDGKGEGLLSAEEQDAVFSINRQNGEIQVSRLLKPFELYKLTVLARNKVTNATDETKVTVALEPPTDGRNRYSPEVFSGYDSFDEDHSHHIVKRSIPSEVTFNLTAENMLTETKVGDRVKFTVDIIFPVGSVDMLVELFTPDNVTTVMILCNVVVRHVGTNLSPSVGTPVVIMDSAENDNITRIRNNLTRRVREQIVANRAIIDLGTVTNFGTDALDDEQSKIYIDYEAITISNVDTVDGGTYWVSAGAEYNNENDIWVGQASFTVRSDLTVPDDASFDVTVPSNMALGSSVLIPLDMYLPYPWAEYTFSVLTPLGTSGVMSVCSIMHLDTADNFLCGNDLSQITTSVTADSGGAGNSQGTIYLGWLLNKGSRDPATVQVDNRVRVNFVVHLYPNTDLIGTILPLSISLEVDTTTIYVGNTNITVDPAVTIALTNPVFVSLTTDLTGLQATIGEPFTVTVDISIPAPATPGLATPYVLEVLAPFNAAGIFKVCSFEIVSIGRDMPCLNKDAIKPTYSTREAGGTTADGATLDLDYVTNINYHQAAGDDIIQVQAILTPSIEHPDAILGSTHTITFGATVGMTDVTLATEDITLANDATISNGTNPTFTMTYHNVLDAADDEYSVGESAKLMIDMKTIRNTMYNRMNMEFLMPVETGTKETFMHICKVEIETAGKNIPCLMPDWTNQHVEYLSTFSNDYIDRSKIDVGSLCNIERENVAAEDDARFSVYLTVLDMPSLNDMNETYISAGLMFTDTSLWAGNVKLIARRGESFTPTGTPHVVLSDNSSLPSIPQGYYAIYSLLLKVPPSDRLDLEIDVTIDNPGLDICSIRVSAAGNNLPCVIDALTTKTYVTPQSANLDFGIVTNFASGGSLSADGNFDDDSIIVEIILHADPDIAPNTFTLTTTSYFDTAKTVSDVKTLNSITTTSDLSGIDQTVTTPVIGTILVGEIAGNDTDANIAVGETKRILLSLEIPENTIYEEKFSISIPVVDDDKLELCDAAIFSAGKNLPCADINQSPVFTSTAGVTTMAEFDMGYLLNNVAVSGVAAENTLVIEAWVRLLPNGVGTAAIGSTVSLVGAITTFGSSISVTPLTLTVTDPEFFVDKVKSMDGISNITLVAIDQTSPISMTIAEKKPIQITVTVPPYSVSKFLFDVELPYDSVSACMTIESLTVTSTIGANIPCFAPDIAKGIVYTPTYVYHNNRTQIVYAYLDLGIITNTGKTHRQGTNSTGDDDIVLEVVIQMADCDSSDDASTHVFSVGNKLANYIFIYDHDITVSRDGNEIPDLSLTLTGTIISSTLIYLDGDLSHTNSSTAEAKNASIYILVPNYLVAPTTLLSASIDTYTIVEDPTTPNLLQIYFENFFFTDQFTFRAAITVDPSVNVPNKFSSANSPVFCEVGSDYKSRAATYASEDWWPYPVFPCTTLSFDIETSATDGCTLIALGMESGTISDCQISGSPDNRPSGPPRLGRYNSGAAWYPGVRNGVLAKKKYFEVYFGNRVQLYEILISQTLSSDLATQFEVEFSNDRKSWFGAEQIDLGIAPSASERKTLATARKTRYVRVKVLNDTSFLVQAALAMNFEFYGCVVTSDIADPCSSIEPTVTRPADFYTRSFLEDPTTGQVYVCDSDADRLDEGQCYTSTDGSTWTALDSTIGSMLGIESTENRVYAYDNDMETVRVSVDSGVTWSAADDTALAEDRLTDWLDAMEVPLEASLDLDVLIPTAMYTSTDWGATNDGMYKSNNLKQRWVST